MKKYKRRNYLINKPLQFAYAGIGIWLLLIGIILIGSLIYYFTLNTLLTQLGAIENVPFDTYQLVKNINSIIAKKIGLFLIFLIIIAGILQIWYLHRIAGPMYRIEKTLKETLEGKKFIPIKLREKDFFKSLAETVNEIMTCQEKAENKKSDKD